jgi:LacI family transcriptional regulator
MAAEHFLARGFECFGFCGARDRWYAHERGRGFVDTLTRRHAPPLECWVDESTDSSAATELQQFITALPKPAAVLACNDRLAWMVGLQCKYLKLRVPEDVAIVGVDNDVIMCQLCHPPLSSVATSSVRIGYEAAALLDRMLAGEPPPAQPIIVAPNGVITRQSSDILAIEDPLVVEALTFIRAHACDGANVETVVRELAISRRRLEQRFQQVLGRTPAAEIRRVRVERACRLLANTEVSLGAVAFEAGFADAPRLTKVFRREMGTTPSEFRQRAQLPDQPI